MSKYAVKNSEGAQVAETELADAVYGIEPNIPVVHQVVVCQDACMRQGTHSVKNRHEVSGVASRRRHLWAHSPQPRQEDQQQDGQARAALRSVR